MTILYENFGGRKADPALGWALIIVGILYFIGFIFLARNGSEGQAITLLSAILFTLLGIFVKQDRQYPIIKATINEKVSWEDINNKYELIEQEGRIYTFKVKNTTVEEWENHLKEKESK